MADPSRDGNPELRRLLWAQLAGELDPQQATQLESLLLGDPAALSEYVAYMRMLIDMRSLESADPVSNEPTGNPPISSPPLGGLPAESESPGGILGFLSVVWEAMQSSPRLVVLTLGGALTAYFVVMLALIPLARYIERADPAHQRSALPGTELARGTDIGSLNSSHQAHWTQKPAAPLASGVRIGDRYELASGLANIVLDQGTRVTVEGPAVWHFVSDQQLQLDSGRIVAEVPQVAIGFTVVTPQATIVDLGTEFGVDVDQQGRTDLHVFRGKVELRPTQAKVAGKTNSAGSIRLGAGESRSIDSQGKISTVPADVAVKFPRIAAPQPQPANSLDLVDLLSGGDGRGRRRNVGIDPRDGRSLSDAVVLTSLIGDGAFHATPLHAVLDGCFIPNGIGPVDSAGHRFEFPKTDGGCCYKFWAGERVDWLESPQRLGPTDYGTDGHVFVLLHPNKGLSLDLSIVRRLARGQSIKSFQATAGNCIPPAHLAAARPSQSPPKADLFVLVDGELRYRREALTPADGAIIVEVPIDDDARFLTIAATDGGDSYWGDWVILGDPQFLLRP